jgi:hypothetical protein
MKLLTNYFKTHAAKQFVESFTEPQNTIYYIGAHKSTSFQNDASPPDPNTSTSGTHYELYDELIFGKRITSSDIAHMVKHIPWQSGIVYDMYDHVAEDLQSKNFYVVSSEAGSYHVFKCLNNNGGIPSIAQPLRSEVEPEDDFYRKSDGYEWKYLYSITASQWQKFATSDYVPVFENSAVTANAVSGSIDTVILENPGSRYASYAIGSIKESAVNGNTLIFSLESDSYALSSNAGFYENSSIYIDEGAGDGEIRTILSYFTSGGERRILVDRPFDTLPARNSIFKISPRVIISGDGENAIARTEANTTTGEITEVIIINRGKDYSYADIKIVGNTGFTSGSTTTSAIARAIISPPGGHGSNVINELIANKIGVSIEFSGTESSKIPATNDYRKITIVKDPLFKDVNIVLNNTATTYTAGETVIQTSTGATGKVSNRSANTISLTDISGFFVTSNTSNTSTGLLGQTSNVLAYINSIDRSFITFDQRNIYDIDMIDNGLNAAGFIKDEIVVQAGLSTINSGFVKLSLVGSAYNFVDGELITQASSGATARVVSRFFQTLTVNNVSGIFVANATVIGANSAVATNVTNVDTTFAAVATGIVHDITIGSNSSISLVATKGEFLISDTLSNTINTFRGESSRAIAKVNGIDVTRNKLVKGSGEFIYVENMIPITRAPTQTERIKLVIEF